MKLVGDASHESGVSVECTVRLETKHAGDYTAPRGASTLFLASEISHTATPIIRQRRNESGV